MSINRIISTFGDHSSLVPIFTKDVVNSLGMTGFSYDAGGKIEAKDRCMDEFGTMAIWIGGLPFFKWVIDKTAYKFAKLNPKVDVRLVKDKDQFTVAKQYAAENTQTALDLIKNDKNLKEAEKLKFTKKITKQNLAKSLLEAEKNSKLFKGLFLGKFAAATALTLASFFTLVKVRQNYTHKQVAKEFFAKKSEEQFYNNNVVKSPAFKAFMPNNTAAPQKTGNKNVSFKGLSSALSSFMFDPVKNLFLIDAGITGERLGSSRTKTEFAEYAIKEGSLIFFLYVAGRYVQEGIEALSEKVFKKPIKLHAEFINSKELKDSITGGTLVDDVAKFTEKTKTNKEIYEFLYNEKNSGNIVVKAAKKSGLLNTLKGTEVINPNQFIEADKIKKLAKNLIKVADSHKASGETLEKFLSKAAKLKVGSVIANMGVTCLFLGLVVPYAMMKYRQKQNGNKEYHVQSHIQQELEKNFKGRLDLK